MAVGEFLGEYGINIGSSGPGNVFFTNLGIIIAAIVIVIIGVAVITDRKAYSKKIIMFREINGIPVRSGSDKAREIILPFTSVRAFLLKKSKFYLPRPSIETGKDEFWFFIREDGEWVNIGIQNLNDDLRRLNLKYDHTDMRMANAALKKLVEKNYKKLNWLKEYAPYIAMGILILMLGIAGYLIIGEAERVTNGLQGSVAQMAEILKALENILLNMDQISVSSGVETVQ